MFRDRDIVQELKERLDYETIFGRYLDLKKVGKTHMAICPFHPDTKPSLSVDLERGLWYCFGCGEGGDIFTFIMKIEGISFREALEELAREAGLELPSTSEKISALDELSDRFHEILLHDSEALKVVADFLVEREIDLKDIKKFHLGYAPKDISKWGLDNLEVRELEDLGIIRRHRGKLYSPFSERLIFPIFDHRGHLRGLGARSLRGAEPKYINTSNTKSFSKGKLLYGLHLAKERIKDSKTAILVEGYLDVITAHNFGFTNTVASMGTALTSDQVKLLKKMSATKVLIAYDGDSSGLRASLRAASLIEAEGLEPRIIKFPDGSDPDNFLREEGESAFEELIHNALPPIEILADLYLNSNLGERNELLSSYILPYINSIFDPVKLRSYKEYLIDIGIPKELLQVKPKRSPTKGEFFISSELQFAMKMLINYPFFKEHIADMIEIEHFTDPDAKLILEYLLKVYEEDKNPDLRELALISSTPENKIEELLKLVSKLALTTDLNTKPEYAQAFLIEKEIKHIRRRLKDIPKDKAPEALNRIRELLELKEKLLKNSS